jgi:ABC-type molybdenum transport system ATPase subunit/photorepair protein PhrA
VLLITQRAEEIVDEVATVSFFGAGGGLNTVRRPKGMAAASLLDLALGLNDGAMLRLPPPPTLEEVAAVWRAPQARSRSSGGGGGVEGGGGEGGGVEASGVEGGVGEGGGGEGGALLVEARGLRVQRGEHVLLEGLDWVVRPGEHWLIAGGNGAGKSTLSRLLVRPDLAIQGAAGVLRVLGVGSTGSMGSTGSSSTGSTGSAGSAGSAAAASATELPEGWTAHTSDKNGRVYYRHEKDKVTTWTRPVASASVPTSTSDGLAANKPKTFLHPAYSRGDASERRMLLRQRGAGDDLARSNGDDLARSNGDELARSKIVSAPPDVGAPPPPPPSESHSHTPLAVSEGEAQQEGARAPAPRRRGVGWLSTEVHLSLASSETLASRLVEAPAADGEDKESHAALISAVYRWLGLDDGLLQRPFRALSQGEQKMVLLAAALVARPRILVLDEPAQGLDLLNRKRLLATVQQVCAATGTGLVYITHHYEEVLPCVTHVLLLKKGGHVAFCGERKAYEEARLS